MSAHEEPGDTPWLKITITPDPAGDEGEVLVTAIAAYLAFQPNPPAKPSIAEISRWQTAGRQLAIRGIAKSPRMGWGRERAG